LSKASFWPGSNWFVTPMPNGHPIVLRAKIQFLAIPYILTTGGRSPVSGFSVFPFWPGVYERGRAWTEAGRSGAGGGASQAGAVVGVGAVAPGGRCKSEGDANQQRVKMQIPADAKAAAGWSNKKGETEVPPPLAHAVLGFSGAGLVPVTACRVAPSPGGHPSGDYLACWPCPVCFPILLQCCAACPKLQGSSPPGALRGPRNVLPFTPPST
jgi:hypothetical protein